MSDFWSTYGLFLWLAATLLALGWLAWLTWQVRRPAAPAGNIDLTQVERTASQVAQLLWSTMEMKSSLSRSIQSTGIVRYQAFADVGGDQSFSLCLADGQGNGLVLSSLYGRSGTRVYAKPLALWASEYNLSPEERAAIEKARSNQS